MFVVCLGFVDGELGWMPGDLHVLREGKEHPVSKLCFNFGYGV